MTATRHALVVATLAVVALIGGCFRPPPTLPPGSPDVVVFDIDGTLSDDAVSTRVRVDAARAVNAFVAKGYNVVYVTARWQVLEGATRTWLTDNGFPTRPLYMPSKLLLEGAGQAAYKTEVLQSIEVGEPEVLYAYGDSSSDFVAYANVGVDVSHVTALRRVSQSTCEPGVYARCLLDYTAHLDDIALLPPAR